MVKFRKLDAAPLGIRPRLLDLIESETARSLQGEAGLIEAKMNSLVDTELIEALYRASQAGVKIHLNVRGICCLRPGVKGLSDNIRVISIVDRFLEHARIFKFHNGGAPRVFIASADWMPRNLDRRIELMVSIQDQAAVEKLQQILKICFGDTQQSWRLTSKGGYERRRSDARSTSGLRAQAVFQKHAEAVAATAVQRQSPVFEPQRPVEKK